MILTVPEDQSNVYVPLMFSVESNQGSIVIISFVHLDVVTTERGNTGRSSPSGSKILTRNPYPSRKEAWAGGS
jgi:hypothetical protein